MKCMICGSERIKTVDTMISDFVMARIKPDFQPDCGQNTPVKLCFCENCTFAFYDHRITDEESDRIYQGYRGDQYQQTRQRFEPWYTPKINRALNHDSRTLHDQKTVIAQILHTNTDKEIRIALDYGGNEGRTFFRALGTEKKYVYDISGVKTRKGVIGISDYDELKKLRFDFIMCCHLFEHLADPQDVLQKIRAVGDADTLFYIEVPSENPFTRVSKFSVLHNLKLMLNPLFDPFLLVKSYLRKRRQPFMPMHEHINFYTKKSMRCLLERSGFSVIALRESPEHTVLGTQTVLSALFRMKA